MRGNNIKSIEKCRKRLSQFTTMNVIDGQAGLVIYSSLIFYSLTIDNILNIIEVPLALGLVISLVRLFNGEDVKAFDFLSSGFNNFGKSWAITFQICLKLILPIILEIVSYIIIAFATIPCIVLIIKRVMVGSLLYLVIYGAYFGEHFVSNIIPIIQGQASLNNSLTMNLLSDTIAIILALFAVMDMLADKGRKANPSDGKTDWYFKNQKYDEELKAKDQREDKNEYKFF